MLFLGPGLRERAELIAIGVIVSERAEFKKMPDTVMSEFELSSARNVSGQKCQHDVFPVF